MLRYRTTLRSKNEPPEDRGGPRTSRRKTGGVQERSSEEICNPAIPIAFEASQNYICAPKYQSTQSLLFRSTKKIATLKSAIFLSNNLPSVSSRRCSPSRRWRPKAACVEATRDNQEFSCDLKCATVKVQVFSISKVVFLVL